ncbi:MAG: hypothetical protein DMD89_18740, partial [Candidatus Rokuibacteriota bacterium]
ERANSEVSMGRLTREERRRVFLAQEKARRAMQKSMACPQSTPGEPRVQRWGLLWLFRAAMIATLLAAGCFAYHAAEFHAPESLVETLLPRR